MLPKAWTVRPSVTFIRESTWTALLRYAASAGQVILLLRSDDGTHWQNVQTAVAHQNTVEFLVRPAPAANGPCYRAIVVDFVSR
jgi:hypothetical protein